MNIIEIPVSPLSRKFILHQFKFLEPNPQNPLVPLTASDILFQQLCYRFPNAKTTQLRTTLSTTISFSMPERLGKSTSEHLWRIGMHLHKLHREDMCQFAAAAEDRGEEVFAALRCWLAVRNIEDEEYSLEPTAIKYYARWRKKHLVEGKKKMSNFHRFNTPFVLSNGENLAKLPPLSDDELIALEAHILTVHALSFQDSRRRPLKKLRQQLKLYIWRKIGRRSPFQVSKKWKVSEYVVRYSVRRFGYFIQTNARLPSPVVYIPALFGQ